MNTNFDEIEKSLILVYQKNLDFLKKNFFDIFQLVEKFSHDINTNKINEKYSLELRNGYFDILNLENNGYYYATNSYIDAEERVKYVDLSTNSSLNLLRKDPNSEKLSIPYGLKEVSPVVTFINKTVDLKDIEFQNIMKYVYVGVGLGYHIDMIEKKIKSYTTLIIEPELEIFRLSLFTMDYSVFEEGNRKLFLSIGSDKVKIEKDFNNFYRYHSYMNYNIQHYVLLQDYNYIKDYLVNFCSHNFIGNFPYSSLIENVKRTISFIRNKDKFIVAHSLNVMERKNICESKEVLLISAGPSLDSYIDVIKKYQNKYIVVCVDVILKKLEKANIVPDIVFSIDPSPLCADYLETQDPKYLKNSMIILLSQQDPSVMDLLRKRNLNYCFSQFGKMIKSIGTLGSIPNVGTFSFHIMVHIGAKKLFTIGNDAAFNQETGARYGSGSSHVQTENKDIKNQNKDVISKEDLMEVKGNLRELITTNRSLISFKNHYDSMINNMRSYTNYESYNLSDGVYIEGLIPMTQNEFIDLSEKLVDKNMDIIKNFDAILEVVEIDDITNDIKILTQIIQRAKRFLKIKIHSKDDFLRKKLDFMIWILEISKDLSIDMFGSIFLEYTNFIDSYINFYLNLKQKDLYSKSNLEQLSNYWAKGVISVFQNMKKSIS